MRGFWISLCGALAVVCSVQATYTYYSVLQCECNGHSRYCLSDVRGLHCVDCEGNTEGRHCEKCKQGFYLKQGLGCMACLCDPTGSVSSQCNSRGHCSCKEGFTGEKCDRCKDSQKIRAHGCSHSRQLRQDSRSSSPFCFCFGHSSQCSARPDYYVHNITSTFTEGTEGWTAATLDGVTPRNIHFRWSPKHQDLEVISSNSLPVYLSAPDRFLGDQLLSYGQNLSFSLRLDQGLSQPSISDVILEGAGLRVSASLGDLRQSVPCGQKLHYTFRLNESSWRPQQTTFHFQSLLQNLTGIKIRATFGENGRGYLDNVFLVSARRGLGLVPAGWVQTCTCPVGLEGDQCERCAAGFRRFEPSHGSFSGCGPCECPGGSCDAFTGDCLAADGTSPPCPYGYSGPGCTVCSEGFYRETVRGDGFLAPCNPCACDVRGSESLQCDSSGKCRCKDRFKGIKCETAECPSCSRRLTDKLNHYKIKVRELESWFSSLGLTNSEVLEAALKSAQNQLENLQDESEQISDLEKHLQSHLASISRKQLSEEQDVHKLAKAVEKVQQTQQTYKEREDAVEKMSRDMTRLLDQAKTHLKSVEIPSADAAPDSNPFFPLIQLATSLAQHHESKGDSIEENANKALSDSEQSLSLVQILMSREYQVKEAIRELRDINDQISSGVKALEEQGTQVGSKANDESKMATSLLQNISNIETNLPTSLKGKVEAMLSQLDFLKAATERNLTDLETFREAVTQNKASAEHLLNKGKAAQEDFDKLVGRVDAAKTEAEDALKKINSNTDNLQDALSTLKGFEEQMNSARALSDAAIGRLPVINSTIQSANRDNAVTSSLIQGVSEGYQQALETVSQLQEAVNRLQVTTISLPDHSGSLDEASKQNTQAQMLKASATSIAAEVKEQLDRARTLDHQAQQVGDEVGIALENTQQTRDAVKKTLQDISNMLNNLNGSEPLDVSRLERLEATLGAAQREVAQGLALRLELMEQREQAQRRHLLALNQDLSTISKDISNINDILVSVPPGCYNNPPIEEA